MKVAVVGGGSSYTPELVSGFLARVDTFPLTGLWLMDVSQARLDVVGGFARRMVRAKGAPFVVNLTTDLREAIRGASYVITQLRVGGMAARRSDEYLGQQHGLIGQETTGVGGMALALRTIPVVLAIAEEMRQLAPGALMVNFTNPAGLVTEALSRYVPDVPAVGVCNVAITTKMEIVENLQKQRGLKIDPAQVELHTLGLNHLSWHRGLLADGADIWPQVMEDFVEALKRESDPVWDIATIKALGMIPNYYLQYYYYTERKLKEQSQWPPSRAEQVMEIEAGLLRQYADPHLVELPKDLMQRGGAYYSTLATQVLNAHYNDLNETHVVNVAHKGAVSGWPADWVLEMPCKVDASGVHPIPTQPLSPPCFGLLAQVKAYEILTVEAAVHGDRRAAHQALLAHPLGPSADRIDVVLRDLLESNRDYLPRFFA